MIEYPKVLLVGRHEVVPDDMRWVWEYLVGVCGHIRSAWEHRWSDEIAAWDDWNVLACVGDWGKWTYFDCMRWEELGSSPIPYLGARWRYVPLLGIVDPQPTGNDPPVLYGSSRLLNSRHWPVKLPGTWAKDPRTRLEEIERKIDQLSLPSDVGAQTRAGAAHSLRLRGYELAAPETKGVEWQNNTASWQLREIRDRPDPSAPVTDALPRWSTLHEAVAG